MAVTVLTIVAAIIGTLAPLVTALLGSASIRRQASKAYGKLTQQVEEHEHRLDGLDEDKDRQWDRIIGAELRLENLRGRHKLNGGHE